MKSKKLFLALLIFVIVAMGMFAVACEKPEEPTPLTEGPETGTYYYDTTDGEYLLTLNSGDKFTLIIAGESKTGTYNLKETVLTLTFNFEGDKTVTAEYVNGTVKLTYDNMSMEFKRKVGYTVTLNSMGGSSIDSIAVVNGRTIAKPADPTREGYVFAGWYKEEACTTPFAFGTEKVTGNVTLYAKWIAIEVGVLNYTVSFELGYENAVNPESVQTLNGKLYEIDTPARSGYIFGGWWISDSENGDKLTREYTLDTVFTQDTTLYAVWNESATVIMPSVSEKGFAWDGLSGITTYSVTVTNEEGEVVSGSASHGSTIYSLDWSTLPAGEYKIVVSGNEIDSVRYYTNKALDRVSLFSVVGNVLTFNAVDNAEVYYITVECGNENHVHTMLSNGESTSFDFSNCPMVEGGIKFTVVAEADGFASSTSRTFVVNRALDKIAEIAVNEATETISWDRVEFASGYVVSIVCENAAHEHVEDASNLINIGNKTSYCYKECAGDVTINVYPVAEGYNSPEYTSVEIEKATLATPTNISINGTVVTWDAVAGATGYELIVNGTSLNATENTLDIADQLTDATAGSDITVSVIAKGTNNSLPSNNVVVRYNAMYGTLKYLNNTVTWRPVAGAAYYDVKVNGKVVATVSGINSYEVELTKEGYNTISVCYYNQYDEVSEDATIEVYAHAIYLEPDNGEETVVLYAATGDEIELPTNFTKGGYTFDGWYNMFGGAKANGAEYTDKVFTETTNLVLYANWKANTYTVTFVYGDGEVDSTAPATAEVVYGEEFTLPTPSNVDATMAFIAWTVEDGVLSSRATNAFGECYNVWSIHEYDEDEEIKLYAAWTKAFNFNLEDGYYTVTKNDAGIHKATELTVPSSYKGIQVKIIGDFSECRNLRELSIPDSIETVDAAAFEDCERLNAINVYNQGDYPDGTYSSVNGILLITRDNGDKEVAFVSKYTNGTYTIPEGVTVVTNVFAGTSISSVVIPSSVAFIRQDSFNGCDKLRNVTFEDGNGTLYIEKGAFANCTMLRSISLPARFALSGGTYFANVFEGCANLERVVVNSSHADYKSEDAVVFSKDGHTLVYYPAGRGGEYNVPANVYTIGAYAFGSNQKLTSVVVSQSVTAIEAYAFNACSTLKSVTIGANVRSIGDYAFYGLRALTTVDFSANTVLETIGKAAFAMGEGIIMNDLGVLTGVVLPQSVLTIGDNAFNSQNNAVTELNIPNATTIGEYAFYSCDNIKTADLRSVSTIGKYAFAYSGLNSVTVGDNFAYEGEEQPPFYECVNLYMVTNLGTKNIVKGSSAFGCVARYASVVITATGNNNFFVTADGKYSYTKVVEGGETIVEIVKYIGNESEVVLPEASVFGNDVTSYTIANGAFAYNTTITSIVIPAAVTAIGEGIIDDINYEPEVGIYLENPAFYECVNLATVYDLTGEEGLGITAGATANGYVAYYATTVATEIPGTSAPTYVTQNGFFFDVTTEEVEGVETIKTVALVGYESTETTVVLPDFYVADEVEYDYTISTATFSGKTVENLTIGKGVAEIPDNLFANNTTLKSLTINGNGETVIGKQAFYRCTSLETIVIKGVKEIGDAAFGAYNIGSYYSSYAQYAVPVKELVFDDYLEKIGLAAFFNCSYLESVEFGDNLTTLSNYAFAATALTEVTVPATVNDCFKGTSGNYIGRYAFANAKLQKITVEEGIQELPNYLFYNYISVTGGSYLTEVNLPNSLTKIGNYCFQNQGKLTSFTVPENVATIGSSAFSACYQLKVIYNYSDIEITVGTTANGGIAQYALAVVDSEDSSLVVEVDDEGFEFTTVAGTSYLTAYYGDEVSIITPYDYNGGTYEIAPYAFYDVYKFLSITLGKNVTAVGKYAFYPQSNSTTGSGIRSIDLNEGLISIGEYAFYNSSIASITIPTTVKKIGDNAFAQNKMMTSATINSGEIGNSAFSGCISLGVVVIGEDVTSIGSSAFSSCSKLYEVYDLSEHVEIVKGATSNGGVAQYADVVYTSMQDESKFEEIDGFKFYIEEDGTVVLASYVGTQTKLILPEYKDAEGNTVNYVVKAKFMEGNASITSVAIPDNTAKEIREKAFYNCKNLETIVIGNSVEIIGNAAFMGYSRGSSYNKVKNLTLGANVKTIGDEAFKNLDQMTGALDLSGVESLGEQAFYYCQGITSVIFGENLTEIPYRTFYNATAITDVILRGPVSIDSSAFYGNNNISYKVDLTSIDKWAATDFASASANPISFTGKLYLNGVEVTELVIPNTVTKIGDYAFAGITGLTKVTIGTGVTSIGNGAFNDTALAGVYVDSLATWLNISFESASANPLTVAKKLYVNNAEVTEVTVPTGITEIKAYAFNSAEGITKLTLSSAVTKIGANAFDGTALAGVYVDSLASWLNIEFANASANPLTVAKKLYVGTTEVTEVTIPTGVATIKEFAFYGAEYITKVTIGADVTSIGMDAFSGCTALTGVYVDSLDTWLGISFASSSANPLKFAKNLYINNELAEEIEIPASVTEIKAYAFYNATCLDKVTLNGATVFGTDAFYGCEYELIVSITDLAAWAATDFASASANPIGVADKFMVSGTEVTELEIPAGVTEIGDYAFAGFKGLTKVTIPASVTKIGAGAFNGCTALTGVYVDSLASWLNIEFANASANPLSIAKKLYVGTTEVTDLVIPAEVAEVKAYAFYGAESIIKVTIGADVTNIGRDAFTGTKLTGVYVADLATWLGIDFANAGANPLSIAGKLYVGGEEVTAIVIPDATTEIKDYAFYGAENVTYVIMPKSVTKIGTDAFANCGELDTVYYMGTMAEWTAISGNKDVFAYVYNYSEAETEEKGNFWHYVDGVPTPWLDEWVVLFEFASTWIDEWEFEAWDVNYEYMERWTVTITKTTFTASVLTSLDDWGTQWPDASAAETYTATNIEEDGTNAYTFTLGEYGSCRIYVQSRMGRTTYYFDYFDGEMTASLSKA